MHLDRSIKLCKRTERIVPNPCAEPRDLPSHFPPLSRLLHQLRPVRPRLVHLLPRRVSHQRRLLRHLRLRLQGEKEEEVKGPVTVLQY